jgi:asparagine synthase (glutamine-hydrolysing)
MCGITGFLGGQWTDTTAAVRQLDWMADAMRLRGPDGDGKWFDGEHRIGLAHRRLAVLELSPAGHQPMPSPTGRYVITFNGEIYNHEDLRRQLRDAQCDVAWRGHSDTETLLAAVEVWGVVGALERAVGMFAFALWDKTERRLFLARDRLGEKPLYYGYQGRGPDRVFLFGSQLNAMARYPGFKAEVDRQALSLLLRYNSIPSPHSIYQGISKLPPGTLLTLSEAGAEPVIEPYWSATRAAIDGVAEPLALSPEQAVDQLEALLGDSVRQQMIADVPVGAFLSGGVDSSAVVALMTRHSARPVRTFSIGFHEDGYSETKYAAAVAKHLGTDHTELFLSADDALAVIPRLPHIYDEPFADSSQIPTSLVSQLARSEVTVSLSGDGGDELFAGYNNYAATAALWKRISVLPQFARRRLADVLMMISPAAWNRIARFAAPVLPNGTALDRVGDRIHKGAPLLRMESQSEFYRTMVSHWRDPSRVVIGGSEPAHAGASIGELESLNPIERMMAADIVTYLSDDILAKVDRAAMAVSLETRVPLLDHRVVEFAWKLPFEYKRRGGVTKWVLRQMLYRHVPQSLIDRPKMGFAVPLAQWLRGPLRDWAEALLDEGRLKGEGYFDSATVRETWAAHLRGSVDMQGRLWSILMFQSWLDARKDDIRELTPAAQPAGPKAARLSRAG